MKLSPSFSYRLLVGAVLTVTSLLIFKYSLERLSFYQNQIEIRQQEKTELARIQESLWDRRAAFDQLSAQTPSSDTLASAMKRTLPGIKNDMVLRETRDAGEGWKIKQYDVRLDQVPPAKLGEFLAACVNSQPPVRLVEVQVSRSRETGEMLAAQLTLAEMSAADLVSAP